MTSKAANKLFCRAGKCASQANPAAGSAASLLSLVVLLFVALSSVGCIGLTGAAKPASNQQSAPGAATFSMAPTSINFGSVALGTTASQSVTITNSGASSLTVTQASVAAAGVNITGASFPMVINAGKQAIFDIVFTPKAAGALTGQVSVTSNLSSSPSMVSLSGTAMAATALLSASTSSLSFGSVAVGKSGTLSVTLTNAGNSDITVSKVSSSGSPYSASGVSAGLILTPGQSATLDATFSPGSAGNYSGSISVASNATNSPDTISLSGSSSQSVSHSVSLTWNSSTSAVAGYHIYRSQVSGGPYSIQDSSLVAADAYIDSSVQGGSTYYYIVRSVTQAGVESTDSMQVTATIP
jgi:hypothetical protein